MRTLLVLALIARYAEAAPLTCADVDSDHTASVDATKKAFEAALAAKQVTVVALERRDIGEFPTEDTARAAVPEAKASWTLFTIKVAGKDREAIAGDVYRTDYVRTDAPELVKDAHGDIWRVQRKPTTKVTKTVTVKACPWGCWSFPGGGAYHREQFTRDVWLLPEKSTYKGDIQIAFVAPTLVVKYVASSQCSPPP